MDNISQQMSLRLNRHSFPKGFVFGSGTSAYQIEGAYNIDGKGESNWDYFTTHYPEKIIDYSNGRVAIDHYHRFAKDVELMKEVGIDSYKFSFSWSRILPGGRPSEGINEKGVKFYNDLIDLLILNGIEPVGTLFHFELPECLEKEYGGFLNRLILRDFVEFADLCFAKFGDRVKTWITENEPWTFTHHGYVTGGFPPGHGPTSYLPRWRQQILAPRSAPLPLPVSQPHDTSEIEIPVPGRDAFEPYIVAHNLILAHAKIVDLYRRKYKVRQGGKIGVTNMTTWFDPFNAERETDVEAAKRAVDFMWGWFVAPIVTGDYPKVMRDRVKERLPRFTPQEKKMVQGSFDFIGMNYYTTNWATEKKNPPGAPINYYTDQEVEFKTEREDGTPIGPQAGSSWLYIVPYGIHSLLKHTHDIYHNPIIYITENGVDEKNDCIPLYEALQDQQRIDYHVDHLSYVKKAINEGVRVKGYYTWSMFDNFEWAEGYTVRFGMIYVDYIRNLTRYFKKSAFWYMDFLDKDSPRTSNKRQIEDEEEVSDAGENKKAHY